MKKAMIEVVVLENEIVTTSGTECECFVLGKFNPDTANDDC